MGISPERQGEIAGQLATASTWVFGTRRVLLENLAKELSVDESPKESTPGEPKAAKTK